MLAKYVEPAVIAILGAAFSVCVYMAWNIGANDVANAMGTSVGSGALTLRRAIIVAAVFEFCGAVFFGSHVTDTIRKGVLDFGNEGFSEELSQKLMYGFMAALLAAAIWLTIATKFGLPVSTTHSIVGGVIGMGLFIQPDSVNWGKVMEIVLSWIASPLLGGILAFASFYIIKMVIFNHENPLERTRKIAPILALPTFFVLGLALQFKGLKGFYKNLDSKGYINKEEWLPCDPGAHNCTTFNPFLEGAWIPLNSFLVALGIGIFASTILWAVLKNYQFKEKGYEGVERVFIWLQIITACYVAFAHGANDVANAIGPMAAIYDIATSTTGVLSPDKVEVPIWLLLIGGAGITVGVGTWGYKVMDTIGKKITHITPSRGFAAEFGAATTVLIFSMPFLAVPISTTHTLVGSVVGVGLAGGAAAVDFRVFGKIAASWIASLPVAGIGAIVFFILFAGNPANVVIVVLLSIIGTVLVMRISPKQEVELVDSGLELQTTQIGVITSAPFELFHEHAKAVMKTVECMNDAINAAASGKNAEKHIAATIAAELDADVIKSELQGQIGSGVRFVIGRETFLHMLSRQDRIADYAQNVAEQLSFRELYDSKIARENLIKMASIVVDTVMSYENTVNRLKELSNSGFSRKEKDSLLESIRDVNLKEHLADKIESIAAAHVFSTGDGDALAAMHMYRVLQRLDDVANACEKAANAFLPSLNH
jgi:PiT family inorganic phosphate transporter